MSENKETVMPPTQNGYRENDACGSSDALLAQGYLLADRYCIEKILGRGGFGITYLAYDKKEEKNIAVKEFFPAEIAFRKKGSADVAVIDSRAAELFRNSAKSFYNEAELASKFNGNPSIVSVYDSFFLNDTVYYTMEYLEGKTLKSYIRSHGRLTEGQAVNVADHISSALMAAHSAEMLHCDISPDNIMVCSNGDIKLIDFGASRTLMRSGSHTVILKRGFAPPEQYLEKGRCGPWTDIYSLGAVLYYSLTLDEADDPMSRIENDEKFMSNSYGIDSGLWEIIKKSTMLKTGERFADIFEFRNELNKLSIDPQPLVEISEKRSAISENIRTAQPAYNGLRSAAFDDGCTKLLNYEEETEEEPAAAEVLPQQTEEPVRKRSSRGIVIGTVSAVFAAVIIIMVIAVYGGNRYAYVDKNGFFVFDTSLLGCSYTQVSSKLNRDFELIDWKWIKDKYGNNTQLGVINVKDHEILMIFDKNNKLLAIYYDEHGSYDIDTVRKIAKEKYEIIANDAYCPSEEVIYKIGIEKFSETGEVVLRQIYYKEASISY